MHFIIFEGTTEEELHPHTGLSLCGNEDLNAVSQGDIVWVITRTGEDRPVPAICGRLVADRVEAHSSSRTDFNASHADSRCRLLVHENSSERCAPFACDMIISWGIWRQPFRGVRVLTDEQGRTLDMEWAKAARQQR